MAAVSAATVRFPDGPPLAHTGAFGEPTCLECHRGDSLNTEGGRLTLVNLPERYQPGVSYDLGVLLRRADMQSGGFELALRFPDGTQAGRLEATVPALVRVRQDTLHGVWYAHHLRPGTAVAGDSARWTVRWTAPDSHQDVVISAAAVSANDDNSNLGDYVYATQGRIGAR